MNETKPIGQTSRLKRITLAGLLVTIGIVYGDIGTSPLYVMKAITAINPGYDQDYIIGAVSCVIWTLTLQTTLKYVILALRADNRGEGGILALFALLKNLPAKWLYTIAAIGASALIADGVITPAITVTSAVEGLRSVVADVPVVPIVIVIICLIFILQQAGTGRIGRFFGPFMLAWFLMLGILGAFRIPVAPAILNAFNPWSAIKLLIHFPEWFLILGAVFLCTTGAEALYSDLGHCGKRNIEISWIFVKAMLITNYLGQGAWLIANHSASGINPFFSIMPAWWTVPGIIFSTGAAIIASQALLSGSFTIFSEAINLGFWPRLKIKYPSKEKGQLYIPAVNWTLLTGCLITVVLFQDSGKMEAAYGLAITVTMLMTTMLLCVWLRSHGVGKIACAVFLAAFATLEGLFFIANMFKFVHGGWFTLLIAGVVTAVMIVWRRSSEVRNRFIDYCDLNERTSLIKAIKADNEIPKTASNLVFFSRSDNPHLLESKVVYSIVNKQPKRADHYWFIHVETDNEPNTLEYDVEIIEPETIFAVTMRLGFRIEPRISLFLRQIVEDLVAENKLVLTSSFPSLRAHGIAGDFRFIAIRRKFSPSSLCRHGDTVLMRMHDRLRHLGITEQEAYGLDTSLVTCETVPLIINTTLSERIIRSGAKVCTEDEAEDP